MPDSDPDLRPGDILQADMEIPEVSRLPRRGRSRDGEKMVHRSEEGFCNKRPASFRHHPHTRQMRGSQWPICDQLRSALSWGIDWAA